MFFIADQIIIYATTPPNEPHQCILTHFNNGYFSKAQIVGSLVIVLYTETCWSFLISILMQILKLFLRLSSCATVGEKTLITLIINVITFSLAKVLARTAHKLRQSRAARSGLPK